MDIATVIGIISASGLVLAAIFMGSGLNVFINIPSLLIVVGGTTGVTLIAYPLKDFLSVFKVVQKALFTKVLPTTELISNFMDFSRKARKEGILTLESEMKNVDDEFLKKGVQLSIDGMEPVEIQNILDTEIEFVKDRHKLGADIFTAMGTFAPAMGMIGTLIGLVQMLQNMDDPSTIGPAMAVALLTTFYGAVMANILYMPIAGKLKNRSQEEMLTKEMTIQGIISLSNGDNPRILEQKLKAFLPPVKEKG